MPTTLEFSSTAEWMPIDTASRWGADHRPLGQNRAGPDPGRPEQHRRVGDHACWHVRTRIIETYSNSSTLLDLANVVLLGVPTEAITLS